VNYREGGDVDTYQDAFNAALTAFNDSTVTGTGEYFVVFSRADNSTFVFFDSDSNGANGVESAVQLVGTTLGGIDDTDII
jgi:hypothetical protein